MTLTEFLTARLDEDEAGAGDWHDARRCGGFDRDGGFELKWCDCGYPARVLREVEAMRKILEDWQAAVEQGSDGRRKHRLTHEIMLHRAVKTLAAVWCDHPDYDPAWRP